MRTVSSLLAAVGVLAVCTEAAAVSLTTSIAPSKTSTHSVKPASTSSSSAKNTGCAAVSAALGTDGSSNTAIRASDALACLKSVPLDAKRSSAYIDFIEPYIQFQSTLAYLKNPPLGWTLPGVDVLGGLTEIQKSLKSGKYKSQWDFEVDLYALVNIFPHDFHFNLALPLLSVFNFQTVQGSLVSVSTDGLSLPEIYFKSDLDLEVLVGHLNWKPSPLISINGVEVADYINYIAQTTSNFQDPDAIFNQAFTSLAFSYNPFTGSGGDLFVTGGHIYGFSADSYNYTFANGTTHTFFHAATTGVDFTDIQNGQDLFDAVDLPPTEDSVAPAVASSTTTAPSSTATAAKSTSTVITSLIGYPSPVVIHPDGYTSGYFLPNSTIAVLAMQGFIDATESDADAAPLQQAAVKAFLAAARKAGSTKLIVDLQANGGGDIFNGFDAFKQLFPTLDPFGASRLRATPEVNYLGTIFSAAGIYNETFNTVFQFQSSLDVNDHPFANWNAEDPPVTIYGDNFTQELRYNFTDSVSNSGGGLNVTGYLSNANAAPQLFKSEDIVLLYDGSCGSTCAVFSELMKSQGGVRSIAVGGRPQLGPMQGVAGSKGAQVYTFDDISTTVEVLPQALEILQTKKIAPPTLPPQSFIPSTNLSAIPLGVPKSVLKGSRFNLRNNMHDGDASQTPLQFVYEAANCKLFYKKEDLYSIQGLWQRVADVAWGKGTCVNGSTITPDGKFPHGAYDTVPFGKGAYSTVQQRAQPGLLEQKCEA